MDEHIRLVRLTKEDIACFQALDPFERLRFLSLPQGFAIGAVYEDGDISETVGLLSGTASSEMLTIEWLVVSPLYRYREIGERLLVETFKMAKAGNIETLSAVLLPVYLYAKTEEKRNRLIHACIKAAVKKYGKGKEVSILIRQEETRDIVEKILGPLPEGRMLLASLREWN